MAKLEWVNNGDNHSLHQRSDLPEGITTLKYNINRGRLLLLTSDEISQPVLDVRSILRGEKETVEDVIARIGTNTIRTSRQDNEFSLDEPEEITSLTTDVRGNEGISIKNKGLSVHIAGKGQSVKIIGKEIFINGQKVVTDNPSNKFTFRNNVWITVPSKSRLGYFIRLGNGNVDIKDLLAECLNVETGKGYVDIKNLSAELLSVETKGGFINVTSIRCALLKILSQSGNIGVSDWHVAERGNQIKTGDGNIILEGIVSEIIETETEHGHVRLKFDGDYRRIKANIFQFIKPGAIPDSLVTVKNENGDINIS